jgi:hypothetical protein
MEEPSYLDGAWFGCRAIYLHGRPVLVLCPGGEPWNGLLIATEHDYQDSIRREFGAAVRHPVLKKWFYLPEDSEEFESAAMEIVERTGRGDRRVGVETGERTRRPKKR